MGVSLTKDKKSRYYVVVRHMGKRESRCVGSVDRRTAMVRVRQVRKELAVGLYEWKSNGQAVVTKHPVFQNYAKDFLEMSKSRLKYTTWTGYRNLINRYLIPEWTDFIVKEIDKQDVKKLLLKCQSEGLNTNNLRICCSAIFQWGVDNDVLEVNVARNLGKTFRNGTMAKQEMQVLSSKEVKHFLAMIPKKWHCFCLLLFRSGLRLGEARALAWQDVDFRIGKLLVRRNFTHGQWATPKSNKSRHVDMTPQLIKALQNRQRTQTKKPIRIGKETVNLVFATKHGQPIQDKLLRTAFKATLKKCHLPENFRVHDCRHTFASLLLMRGLPVLFVQRQLGHASAVTTLAKYAHFVPAENSHSTNVLDD